jgi:DNA replication initiation complex subunit (GINS family)
LTTGAVSMPGITSYKQGNLVAPEGFSVSQVDETTIRVTATGSSTTPAERLVKIATARAAEYGAEQRKKTFRASEPVTTTKCGKTYAIERGERRPIAPNDYRIVSIDVTFPTGVADAGDRPTKATAAALRAELDAETVSEDVKSALATELSRQCGR